MKGKGLVTYDIGRDRDPLLLGSFALAISNTAFVLTLQKLPIASSFALLIMVNPLALTIAKNWRFPYTPEEYVVLGVCGVGIAAIGHPWNKNSLVGLTCGVLALCMTSFYEKTRKTLSRPAPL